MSQEQNAPLFPLPGNSEGPHRELTPLDPSKQLGDLGPDDTVVAKRTEGNPYSRDMLLPAGNVLSSDGLPLSEAPDGAVEHLDPNQVTVKLGGEAIAHTFQPDDPRLEQ